MNAPAAAPLHAGQVLEIEFPAFRPRIVLHSEHELTVEIISGDNAGFADTVACEFAVIRDGLAVLSWQEHIGTTVVHVLDFISERAHTRRSRRRRESSCG